MEIREELKYVKSHEWVKEEDGVAVIGLTDYGRRGIWRCGIRQSGV